MSLAPGLNYLILNVQLVQDQIICCYFDPVLEFWHTEERKHLFSKNILLENGRNLINLKPQFPVFRWLIWNDVMRTTVDCAQSNYLIKLLGREINRLKQEISGYYFLCFYFSLRNSKGHQIMGITSSQFLAYLTWNYLWVFYVTFSSSLRDWCFTSSTGTFIQYQIINNYYFQYQNTLPPLNIS